jgi:hypothetical protein
MINILVHRRRAGGWLDRPTHRMSSVRVTAVLCVILVAACSKYVPPTSGTVDFHSRAETQTDGQVSVTAVVLSAEDIKKAFGAPLLENDIQPVWLRIENHDDREYFLMALAADPNYFSPSEAAWKSRRFGEGGTEAKMKYFRDQAVPVVFLPKSEASGFLYTNFDPGAKAFAVELVGEGIIRRFEFVQEVPGFVADYTRSKPESRYSPTELQNLDIDGLRSYLESLPCCVLGADRKSPGDPLNLVVVGTGRHALATFVRQGWDMTETVRIGSAWQTMRSALFGSRYRTSPVSSLYLFDRPQDIALQKARASVDERNHLRLWRAPVNFEGTPVWVGQISRDIGLKLSGKAIVTHKIDPAVDEARFYALMDIAASQYLGQAGYAKGVGHAPATAPRYNYTEDPYFTDGLRLVLFISEKPMTYEKIQWLDWESLPVDAR